MDATLYFEDRDLGCVRTHRLREFDPNRVPRSKYPLLLVLRGLEHPEPGASIHAFKTTIDAYIERSGAEVLVDNRTAMGGAPMGAGHLDQAGDRRARIEAKLWERLQASHVEVVDESQLHAGHPGAASGAGHFSVVVVSARFRGLSIVDAQRLVYEALTDEMEEAIHALRIRTLAE